MNRYTRIVLASEYALARYKLSGSLWWLDRYRNLEAMRIALLMEIE